MSNRNADSEPQVAGIILAAGRGRRFGGDKLLAPLAGDQTVIAQTAGRMAAAVEQYVCVVRADDRALQQHLQHLGIPWTIAADADAGMSQSLLAGIRHFAQADGWLIALGDMPHVEIATLQQLCQQWRWRRAVAAGADRAWIAVPAVSAASADGDSPSHWRRGNPVLFGCEWREELAQLRGDVGGKTVLAAHPDRVLQVEVEDANILRDIDTPQDL